MKNRPNTNVLPHWAESLEAAHLSASRVGIFTLSHVIFRIGDTVVQSGSQPQIKTRYLRIFTDSPPALADE